MYPQGQPELISRAWHVYFRTCAGRLAGRMAWKKIIPLLERSGHRSYPVTLTGMGERVHLASKDIGIQTAIQDVQNIIRYNDLDHFVLVGHSFAGKVVAAVADREHEKVSTLLYLDAFQASKVRTAQGAFDPQEFPSPPDSWTIPFTEGILDSIGKDVKGPERKWMLSKGTPWPKRLANDPITLSEKFDMVRTAYIFCTDSGDPVDEILAGKWGKLEGPHKVIESGHYPMITKPDELAKDMIALTSE